MTFPFVIELEQNIKTTGETSSELNVFTIIQTYLKSKSVDDFHKTENIIKFKKGIFGMNTNAFAIIDKGEFELVENNGQYKLKYRFYLFRHFIISTILSIGLGIISQQFIFAIIAFIGFALINFIICFIRQLRVINELVSNIDEAYKNNKKERSKTT
jgi:hypothetical protein